MDEDFRRAALDYHRLPRPGKLAIEPTKRMATQRDLGLAYSPGVAAACEAIAADPSAAYEYTTRGNMVAVITNGTAVLGLGAIGALASKPVMEGKAVLFKKFAGIDSIDIEVEERDPAKFIEVVAALEPSFGAINLEDIKAPECFVIEATLRERMRIPVFHDDQHGTAIIVAAAVRNGLLLQGKRLEDVRLVNTGGGAAALACLDLLVSMGLKRENVTVCDIGGVIHTGRNDLDPYRARYAQATEARTLEQVLPGADIFLGLSAPRVLRPEWLKLLAPKPLVLALANPEPEILPEAVRAARPDAIVATGRTDYPNQVNNVLCFPYIFRGALDVGATTINEAMKIAAADAIAALARVEASEVVAAAYGGVAPVFGPDYIIPKPFDPRLILEIAPAVAKAAMDSGVATRPIADDTEHTLLPKGILDASPMAGLTLNAMVFRHSRFPNAAKALLTFLLEQEQYDPWLQANLGYWSQPLEAYSASAVWDSDPKVRIFKDVMRSNFYIGYRGPISQASAAANADYIMVQMCAQVASGQATPEAAAREAERRAARFFRRR